MLREVPIGREPDCPNPRLASHRREFVYLGIARSCRLDDACSDELTVITLYLRPDGRLAISLLPTCSIEQTRGEQAIVQLQ